VVQLEKIDTALEPAIETLKERVSTLSERKAPPPPQEMGDFEELFGERATLQAHTLVDSILAKLKVRAADYAFQLHQPIPFFFPLIKNGDSRDSNPLNLLAKATRYGESDNDAANLSFKETRECVYNTIANSLAAVLHLQVSILLFFFRMFLLRASPTLSHVFPRSHSTSPSPTSSLKAP